MPPHAAWPEDPGLLPLNDWTGEDEDTQRRNAQVSLELQLLRIGIDPSLEVSGE